MIKKANWIIGLFFLMQTSLLGQVTKVSSSLEKTGWLVYYDNHVIWVEGSLPKKIKSKSFFKKRQYQNGLIVDYLDNAKKLKASSKSYTIKILTNLDTLQNKMTFAETQKISIVPVKTKIELKSDSDQLDMRGLTFKKNNLEVTMDYWFVTNYRVVDVELANR